MTISEEALERIADHAIHMDWDIAFGGKSRGNQHLKRVNKIVIYLANHQKARMDISVAGGWLHDIGLVNGNEKHCFTGVALAREYLEEDGQDQEDIERVLHCIEAHDGEIVAETTEAKVVHDADTIDKMGPFGFVRHVWKISLVEDVPIDQLVERVGRHIAERESKLYFDLSRELVGSLNLVLNDFLNNKEIAVRTAAGIAKSASEGIPSEKVADGLLRTDELEKPFKDAIARQVVADLF